MPHLHRYIGRIFSTSRTNMDKKLNARAAIPVAGESLSGVELFAELDLAERQAVAERCTGRQFAAGELVLNHRDTSREVFFVLSGTVEVGLFSLSGKRVSFQDKGAGQAVGELAAVDGAPRCAHVLAHTDCRTASMTHKDFLDVVHTYPRVSAKLMQALVRQIRELSARVFEFNALCVNNRIQVELLRCATSAAADGNQRLITPVPTHTEIASRVSTHREAVTREMSRLAKQGLLERAKDALIVKDFSQLQALVEQSLGKPLAVH